MRIKQIRGLNPHSPQKGTLAAFGAAATAPGTGGLVAALPSRMSYGLKLGERDLLGMYTGLGGTSMEYTTTVVEGSHVYTYIHAYIYIYICTCMYTLFGVQGLAHRV